MTEEKSCIILPQPKLIIVEGPDACGKTSLAKYIARRLKGVYMRSRHYSEILDSFNLTLDNAEECMRLSNLSVILDRHWPSECAYGPVLRPYLPTQNFIPLAQKCAELGVLYVWCYDEGAKQRHALSRDPDHPYTDEQYNRVCENYVVLAIEMYKQWPNLMRRYDMKAHGADMEKFLQEKILH